MIISRFLFLFLMVAGCAAAAYVISRHIRQLEKQQLKESLRTWEGEGGRSAPSEAPPWCVSPGQFTEPRLDIRTLVFPRHHPE